MNLEPVPSNNVTKYGLNRITPNIVLATTSINPSITDILAISVSLSRPSFILLFVTNAALLIIMLRFLTLLLLSAYSLGSFV